MLSHLRALMNLYSNLLNGVWRIRLTRVLSKFGLFWNFLFNSLEFKSPGYFSRNVYVVLATKQKKCLIHFFKVVRTTSGWNWSGLIRG